MKSFRPQRAFSTGILSRYVFREISVPFLISLFIFTGVLFLVRVLKLFELIISRNVPITDILLLFSYIVPRFLEVALPMSLLLGIILAFSRLSSDSELVVMRASGLSLKQLLKPVIAFSVLSAIITLLIGCWIRPWANYQLGVGVFEIAKMQASSGLVAGVFNEMGPLTLYAERVEDKTGRLANVIISDGRDPSQNRTFIAKHGQLVADNQNRTLTLRLFDGSIHHGTGLNYELTDFDVNNISLEADALVDGGAAKEGKKPNEMFIGELRRKVASYSSRQGEIPDEERRVQLSYLVEYHSRYAIPVSCFFVAIIAMALGIQPSRGGYSWGTVANVTAGIMLIVVYYLLFAFMSALGKKSAVPVGLLMWIPNAALCAVALFLFRLIESERWLAVSQMLGHAGQQIAQRLGITDSERLEVKGS